MKYICKSGLLLKGKTHPAVIIKDSIGTPIKRRAIIIVLFFWEDGLPNYIVPKLRNLAQSIQVWFKNNC